MHRELRLITRDRVDFVARFVYPGTAYGPDRRTFSNERRLLVEFARPRLGGDQFVAVVAAEALTDTEWPGREIGIPEISLPAREIDRLRRWVASPSSVEDTVAFLVGDCEELDKAGVALRGLQLDLLQERGGAAAVARSRRLPPQLVVVGDGVQGLEPLDVVRRLRAAPESRSVPVVAIGGDEAEARVAGAALHVALPPDYRALTNDVSELLGLV